jgi:hypothetical protein
MFDRKSGLGWIGGFMALALAACGTTQVKSTWRAADAGPYGSILVLALVEELTPRTTVENTVARVLRQQGTPARASLELLRPDEPDLPEALRQAVDQMQADAVLVLRPIDEEELTMDAPDTVRVLEEHFDWWPYRKGSRVISRSDEVIGSLVTVETSLYEVGSRALVWRAESETAIYDSARKSVEDYAKSVAKALADQKVILSN